MTTDFLFPVETINRELDYRLFLAASLAARGHRIFLGRADELRSIARHGRGGVYAGRPFDPFFPHCDLSELKMLAGNGYRIVHVDEEGAIFPGREEQWHAQLNKHLDPHALDADDHVCAWGEFQRDHFVSQAPACAANVHVTGTPRFDLYKERYREYFRPEVDKLRRELGDFVLINTNLSTANDGVGIANAFTKRSGYDPTNPPKRLEYVNFWAHVTHVLASFVALVTRLSIVLPKTTFVVRPHPSENEAFYQAVFGGAANIQVRRDGAVAPWLLSAKLMIHDGWTTAVEAAMCGLPIVSYKVFRAPDHDQYLPNLLGILCTTEDDAEKVVRDLLAGGPDTGCAPEDLEPRAKNLLLNLTDESLPRMEEVMNAAAEGAGGDFDLGKAAYRLERRAAEIREHGTELLLRPFSPKRRAFQRYSTSKFFGLRKADALGRLSRVQQLLGKQVRGTLVNEALLIVEPG